VKKLIHDCVTGIGYMRCFQEEGAGYLCFVGKGSHGIDGCLPRDFYFTSFFENGLGMRGSCDCLVWDVQYCPICGYEAKPSEEADS
jgi:hypothetical protein